MYVVILFMGLEFRVVCPGRRTPQVQATFRFYTRLQ
jgi:hypothetical protein